MHRFAHIALLCFFLASCERDADIALPESKPKMSLACFISPNQPIQATLIPVIPVFGAQPGSKKELIPNATIGITDGIDTAFMVLVNQSHYEVPSGALAIQAGKKYTLFAKADGFPGITASCTVPTLLPSNLQLTYSALNRAEDSLYTVQLNWLDPLAEDNYYRVEASTTDSLVSGAVRTYDYLFPTHFYSDLLHPGEAIQSGTGSYASLPRFVGKRWVLAQLITCDVNYYRYHLSLESVAKGNPFQEPVSLYSNVDGGVGCFGAYYITTETKRIF
jgi:hypothetical protein